MAGYRSTINTKPVRIYRNDTKSESKPESKSAAMTAQPQSSGKRPKINIDEESAHPKPDVNVAKSSPNKKDLMISYSHADKEIMLKVRDNLEKYGISVWVDVSGLSAGVDFLSKIGEAIIDCKLFLSLLSPNSVKSKYCQDELALAYVSNRAIFPVAIQSRKDLLPLMDTGMKLQLASYEWVEIGQDPAQFDEKFQILLKYLKDELLRQENPSDQVPASNSQEKESSPDSSRDKVKPPLMRQQTRSQLYKKKIVTENSQNEADVSAEKYWKEHFGTKEDIPFEEFWTCFTKDYKDQLSVIIGNEEDLDWLKSVLSREMEVDDQGKLYKFELEAFCNIEGEYYGMWERVNIQASESWAMKEVFDMNSSVRVDAIENLGKFRTAAVIDALRDLLSDEDANARAVAAVSLARTDANDPVTVKFLMKTLNDKDRLVREAGCLALGHLQARQAVNKLLHMWRNDVISHVREAANVALNQIGGPEVEKAMRVTKVLADEIRQLTAT